MKLRLSNAKIAARYCNISYFLFPCGINYHSNSAGLTNNACAKDPTHSVHSFLPTCFGNPGVPSSGNSYVDINCASE